MGIFHKQRRSANEHLPEEWDQKLYLTLFKEESSFQAEHGHSFGCLLTERLSTLSPATAPYPAHTFQGRWGICLNQLEHEFCTVVISLHFEKPDERFDRRVNEFDVGFMAFGWLTDRRVKRPSMQVWLKDSGGLSDEVSRLFVETRACGILGIQLSWAAKLSAIIGKSAVEAIRMPSADIPTLFPLEQYAITVG